MIATLKKKKSILTPNIWDFGNPEPTADYITDLFGIKRWNNQRKAEKGDIIFDGCFYYLTLGQGVCSVLQEGCENLIFKIPPVGFYRWMGSERANKIDVQAIIDNTEELMQKEVDKVVGDYGAFEGPGISDMGRKIISKEISRRINDVVKQCKAKIAAEL